MTIIKVAGLSTSHAGNAVSDSLLCPLMELLENNPELVIAFIAKPISVEVLAQLGYSRIASGCIPCAKIEEE